MILQNQVIENLTWCHCDNFCQGEKRRKVSSPFHSFFLRGVAVFFYHGGPHCPPVITKPFFFDRSKQCVTKGNGVLDGVSSRGQSCAFRPCDTGLSCCSAITMKKCRFPLYGKKTTFKLNKKIM